MSIDVFDDDLNVDDPDDHDDDAPSITVLRANPHRFGAGRIHAYDFLENKTRCGRTRAECPGIVDEDDPDVVTCKVCVKALESTKRQEEWQARRVEWQAQQAAASQQWWAEYNAYLQTPEWKHKRQLVMARAGGICEGCGERSATQVHHLTYDRVRREMLFDLVAICGACHAEIHGKSIV